MKSQNNSLKTLTNGILRENPVFVMLLGMCPSLAVTTMAQNGLGMGLATTFVLICSNLVISLLRNIIPKQVRLPCYIVIIAGFVTFVKIVLEAFVPDLYSALGIFLNLITVNCIILGRAEAFASGNRPIASILDGLGMGIGFTIALFIVGSLREIFGMGMWMGIEIMPSVLEPMTVFIMPAGGFFTLGIVIAVVGKISKKPVREIGCEGCAARENCAGSCK